MPRAVGIQIAETRKVVHSAIPKRVSSWENKAFVISKKYPIRPPDCNFSVPFVQIDADDDFDVPSYAAPNPRTKYGRHCGKVIASLAEICPKCGVRQHDMPDFGASSPSAPNKVTACLSALFLGLLGEHKFYLGERMMGVFYLVVNVFFFWTFVIPVICMLVTLIEGLLYLTYSDVDFARKFGHRRTA